MAENEKKEEAGLEKLLELETVCPECNGRGSWKKAGVCDRCNGHGAVPTEFGERILALIQNNRARIFR
jgi:DnaJ-class molecular chaperone